MTDPYIHVHAALGMLARRIWGEPVHVYIVTNWHDVPESHGPSLELRITRGTTWGDAALLHRVVVDNPDRWEQGILDAYRDLLARCLEDLDVRANRTR